MIDIPTLITKLRNAPQRVERARSDGVASVRYDEWRVILSGEEREWLTILCDAAQMMRDAKAELKAEAESLKQTLREG